MFKAIKEFFLGKPAPAVKEEVPYKVETPAVAADVAPQPVAEVKADPVAVALDLEPMTFAAPAEPAKKPRKPRAPKAAEKTAKPAKKPAAKKAPKKAK